MSDESRYKELKEVIALHEYLDTLGADRPRLSEILKALSIEPKTMWACIQSAAIASEICIPEARLEIINQMFKLGVTVGYKYLTGAKMDKEFGVDDDKKDN